MLFDNLPISWQTKLGDQLESPYYQKLADFVAAQRQQHTVYPPSDQVFSAFRLTSPEHVKVVILGQDPYHGEGQAHGLSFSVSKGVKTPPSLRNIFKELQADLGCAIPEHGCLEQWARQGVLLLNTVLTVRAASANSHRKQGWEEFTNNVIRVLNDLDVPLAFVLWGKPAQAKKKLIDSQQHFIVESAHPSPLSAHNGFFGSAPFSKVNAFLKQHAISEIDWCLRNEASD